MEKQIIGKIINKKADVQNASAFFIYRDECRSEYQIKESAQISTKQRV